MCLSLNYSKVVRKVIHMGHCALFIYYIWYSWDIYRIFMRYLGNCCHNPSRLLVLTTTPQFHVRKIWAKKSGLRNPQFIGPTCPYESGRTLRYFPKSKGAIVHMAEKSPKLAMEGSSFAGKIIELADRGVRIWNGSPKPKGVIYGDVLPRLWKNVHRYIISQIYIYIYIHRDIYIYYIHRYIICLGKVCYFTKMNLAAIWGWFPES